MLNFFCKILQHPKINPGSAPVDILVLPLFPFRILIFHPLINSLLKHFLINLIIKSIALSTEAVAQRCSVKKMFLQISQNSQENTRDRVSFLIKLQDEPCNFIKKEALAQLFSCEFCEISKNTFP